MKKLILSFLVCVTMSFSTAFAQETPVQIHPGDLTPEQQEILRSLKDAADESVNAKARVEKVKSVADEIKGYASVGAEVGNAVGEAIVTLVDRLGVEVNEFLQSPAGTWTVVIIILYIFGGSIWQVTVGTIVWMLIMTVIWSVSKRFLVPIKIETFDESKKLTDVEFKMPYKFSDEVGRIWAFALSIGSAISITVIWFFAVMF